MSARIERQEAVLVYSDPENPWVHLYFDRVKWPNGTLGRFNRIVEGKTNAGVAVLPIAGAMVGLIRQFRYPIDEEVWEIPRGFSDTTVAAGDAARELKEETGLAAKQLIPLGQIHPNSGLLSATVLLFAAVCDNKDVAQPVDTDEVIEFKWFPTSWVFTEAAEGRIKDAFTIAALFRAHRANLLSV